MFEFMTFETILNDMLSSVPDTLDKREGSVIYDALAPAAIKIQELYLMLDAALSQTFAGTASRNYLIDRAAEFGIVPNSASATIRKALFTPSTIEIPAGTRFSCGDLYFYISSAENGEYQVTCETVGESGNEVSGVLIPTENINGLESAVLGEVIVYGEDDEDTETFRNRFFSLLANPPENGNVAQYSAWCDAYDGIGRYKILPLWDGPNTVKVSILSSDQSIASRELIDEFQEYLDPGSKGLGNGKAPLGAKITVSTAEEVILNISANILLAEGYTDVTEINTLLTEYLKKIAYQKKFVSYIGIGAVINDCRAVESLSDLLINEGTDDIILEVEQIATLGEVNWTVIENA